MGIKARDFIAKSLAECTFVLAKSYWLDKFNRYLVDIYYQKGVTAIYQLVETGKFLNQELVANGLVSRYFD